MSEQAHRASDDRVSDLQEARGACEGRARMSEQHDAHVRLWRAWLILRDVPRDVRQALRRWRERR
jgi:hypothetical protein